MSDPRATENSVASERQGRIVAALKAILNEVSGMAPDQIDTRANFLELGFDSLLLVQVSQVMESKFTMKFSIVQLLDESTSLEVLARQIDQSLPPEAFQGEPAPAPRAVEPAPRQAAPARMAADQVAERKPSVAMPPRPQLPPTDGNGAVPASLIERIMAQQLEVMAQQLEALRSGGFADDTAPASPAKPVMPAAAAAKLAEPPPSSAPVVKTDAPNFIPPFQQAQVGARGGLTDDQQKYFDEFAKRYVKRTQESKRLTQLYRPVLADARASTGFKLLWKEIVYPIVGRRSLGSKFWDVDGNEFVDITMGFGLHPFGHSPEFIVKALEEQLKEGIALGPQSHLAGKVAALACELTGLDRAIFCNSGTEAVMGALKVCRTFTRRNKIVMFNGSYHGWSDSTLARAVTTDGKLRSLPVAPGVPPKAVEDVLVLDYDKPESLEIIKAHAHELAAVLVEPVQSRQPHIQPREFLHELRRITEQAGIILMFDEMITGFRIQNGGAQAHFGVKADLATYGKLIGGGMAVGMVAGKSAVMDVFDGGMWQFGDDSFPPSEKTLFTGAFFKHPLTMAAAWAILNRLKNNPKLLPDLNFRTTRMADEINAFCEQVQAPFRMITFGSLFRFRFFSEPPQKNLFFYHLLHQGVYYPIETGSCFLSEMHTDADIEHIIRAVKESTNAMLEHGFFFDTKNSPPAQRGLTETSKAQPTPRASAPVVCQLSPATTLARNNGHGEPVATPAAQGSSRAAVKFSLYFFGDYPPAFRQDKYDLLFDAVKYADKNDFYAVWIPERHFHSFGGFSPNPSVLASALARETTRIKLRGGSVVLPLHHPVRVAEEWSVVDNLSKGRVGISIATGWHPNDFVFAPENYAVRHDVCLKHIELIRTLWSGGTIPVKGGAGNELEIGLIPLPMQRELPIWLSGVSPKSYELAGQLGAGVLTNLQDQTLAEVGEKIKLYRASLAKHGHDPKTGRVTALMHAFIGDDLQQVREQARRPFCNYLKASLKITQNKIASHGGKVDVDQVPEADMEFLLNKAYERYVQERALVGTVESSASIVDQLVAIGVDEIGCLIDFGVDKDSTLHSLTKINQLRQRYVTASDGNSETAAPRAELSPTRPASTPLPAPTPPASPVTRMAGGSLTVPVTEGQKGLLFLARMNEQASRAYHESFTFQLSGPLNLPALRQAYQTIVDRHEALRTTFSLDGESQIIAPHLVLDIPLVDFSQHGATERDAKVREYLTAYEQQPFDLIKGPLLAVRILKLDEQNHLLVTTIHHLVCDGHSIGVLLDELRALYAAGCQGAACELREPLPYRDYVRWQAEKLQSPEALAHEAYWADRFKVPPPPLELPADHPRPPVKTYNGARQGITLNTAITRDLKRAGAKQGCTLFMTLLGAYQLLLHRLSGQDDVVVGVASSAPFVAKDKDLFGYVLNVLPIRSQANDKVTAAGFLGSIKQAVLAATEHQGYFFGRLIQKLNLPRDHSRSPLFSAMFNLDRAGAKNDFHGLEVSLYDFPCRGPLDTSRFDVGMNVVDRDGELLVEITHNSDLFDAATVQRWLRHFQTLIESIIANPEHAALELPLLTEAERRQLLVEWNDTRAEFPGARCLHQLIEAQVERTPDQTALVFEDQKLTYRELNRRANHLAHQLRAQGAGPETPVAICVDRSLEMVVGLFGILKSGAAYVALDPVYPADRLRFMIEDSKASLVVTQKQFAANFSTGGAKVICLDALEPKTPGNGHPVDANPQSGVAAENLAYVIYTSGSTGQPKGVAIEHRQIVNYVQGILARMEFVPGANFATVSTIAADLGNTVVFPALCVGGCLHVISAERASDPKAMGDYCERHQIDCLKIVPSHLAALQGEQQPGRVLPRQRLIVGGEASRGDWVAGLRKLAPDCIIFNHYGPTETTVGVLTYRVGDELPNLPSGTLPLGRPLANSRMYILDAHRQPTPIGVAGELFIGGSGVARGYLNRPELTAERFIADTFNGEPGARLYRTGDLARYLPDGNIEFLGRVDHQVKIRGFRIELGEIEQALRQHASVSESVVLAREDTPGDKRLAAYVVPGAGKEFSAGELRSFLKDKLPDYMVPAAFVRLDALPLTPNGKVDRRALPAPDTTKVEAEQAFTAPTDALEFQMQKIWERVLNAEPIGVRDNFFDLGGHSIMAIKLFAQIEELTGKRLPLATLLHAPTIEQLAAVLRQDGWAPKWTSLVPIQPKGSRLPFFCVHAGGGNVLFYRDLAKRLGEDQPFYGLQAQGIDDDQPRHTRLDEMAAHYIKEMRSLQPEGPYLLGGASSGGLIAYEMAQQLRAVGQPVGLVALFDTCGPGYPKDLPSTTPWLRKFYDGAQRIQHHMGSLIMLEGRDRLEYVLAKAKKAKKRFDIKRRNKLRHLQNKLYVSMGHPLPANLKRAEQSLLRAADEYVAREYPERITLFRALSQPLGIYRDPTLGWGKVVTGELEIYDVPGFHGALVAEPRVRVLVQKLVPCLDRVNKRQPAKANGVPGRKDLVAA